jgi:hypothetical protein
VVARQPAFDHVGFFVARGGSGPTRRAEGNTPAILECSTPLRTKDMSDVTRIISAIEQGDPHAAEQLLPLVYDELRTLASQRLA